MTKKELEAKLSELVDLVRDLNATIDKTTKAVADMAARIEQRLATTPVTITTTWPLACAHEYPTHQYIPAPGGYISCKKCGQSTWVASGATYTVGAVAAPNYTSITIPTNETTTGCTSWLT